MKMFKKHVAHFYFFTELPEDVFQGITKEEETRLNRRQEESLQSTEVSRVRAALESKWPRPAQEDRTVFRKKM